jgi:hypothetical protein
VRADGRHDYRPRRDVTKAVPIENGEKGGESVSRAKARATYSAFVCCFRSTDPGRKERMLKRFIAPLFAIAALALPAAAVADSCSNVSRAPAACGFSCTGPVIDGNWVWLPSIGVPVAAWGFAPPGGADSTGFGFPGANGNYTNGQTSSLLGMSHNCPPGSNTNRQTTHGIQSGCQ